ncbi:MAG: hypothetical protein ABIF88_03725 [archaeon]
MGSFREYLGEIYDTRIVENLRNCRRKKGKRIFEYLSGMFGGISDERNKTIRRRLELEEDDFKDSIVESFIIGELSPLPERRELYSIAIDYFTRQGYRVRRVDKGLVFEGGGERVCVNLYPRGEMLVGRVVLEGISDVA